MDTYLRKGLSKAFGLRWYAFGLSPLLEGLFKRAVGLGGKKETGLYVYVYVCMYVCMYFCIFKCMYVYLYVGMYAHVYTYSYNHKCIYVYTHIYTYSHIYRYIPS
jgi:hypothetical protein